MLVSIDGAGASHDVIDDLTSLTTAPEHARRARRVQYTIGWPVDEPTRGGIEQLRHSDWPPRCTPTARSTPPRRWPT
jgi:hypothetical protein